MKTLRGSLSGLMFLLLAAGSAVAAPDSPDVELITDTEILQPSSTLEFRFKRAMVPAESIGLPAESPPIRIEPPMPGRFTWLSTRSGVHVPDGPPRLGATFQIALRPGVKAVDGKPIGAFRATVRTPAFGVSATRNGFYGEDDIPPQPDVKIAFNLAVNLTGAEGLFRFVNDRGGKVAASVRHATARDYFPLKPEESDWEERWRLAREPAAETAAEDDEEGEDEEEKKTPAAPQFNRIIVSASTPLGAGGTWRLEMKPGLKSQAGDLRISEPLVVPLGVVKPFTLQRVETSNYIHSGRAVVLEFSHEVAPDVTAETAAKFFRVEPAVPNLQFDTWNQVTLRGDFALGQEYRLHINPAVVSSQGQPFAGERERLFRFDPVKPRLYLPEITGHQIRGGHRKFEVLSANLKSIRVLARLVEPGHVAEAVAAFQQYDKNPPDQTQPDEMYQPLPAGAIPGKVICDRTIELPAGAVDARQQTTLNWNDLLGAQPAGSIFLTVEGLPLTEVGGKRPGAQALIQLTDLGVLWKKIDQGLRVSVFSMASGQALEGVRVALLDAEFKDLGHAASNAEGEATIPPGAIPAWLVVRQGDDVHALRIGREGSELPMHSFHIPIDYRGWEESPEEAVQYRALIFSERPLYRPGETVRIKGLVRRVTGQGLEAAGNLEATLKFSDERGRELGETSVRTDERGAFDTSIELRFATMGRHSLRLELPNKAGRWQRGFSCEFVVADYQPNAFELAVALPPRVKPGAAVEAGVTAKYLFGAPLTDGEVRWTLRYVRDAFSPAGFENWRFGDEDRPEEKILTLRGEGSLAGAKGFTIQPQLPEPKDTPFRGVLTTEVTDINQQTVSDSRLFLRDAADFYVGIAPLDREVIRAGEEVVARVVAVRSDGQPLGEPVKAKVELIHRRFETVRVQGAGKAISFRTETVTEPAGESMGSTLSPVRNGESWEAPAGETARFKVPKPGSYHLRVTARDSAGREVASVLPFYVSGAAEIAWDYRNPAQMDMVLDKPEYQPGDVARILVKTPISGEALVTVERQERILRSRRVKLEGNAPAIEIPIEKTDAPNVFVSVVLIRGAEQSTRKFKTPEYRYGVCNLRIADSSARLQVELNPARPEVRPGDEVETEIRVRDGKGLGVGDAEVTFFAVDDGVLALTGYERPMPGPIFGAPFSLEIRTGLTLFELLPEDPAELEFSNKGYLIGGGGLEGPGLKLRRDFPGTACWEPSLRTDAEGRVKVRFPAPDAITRYRLVAVAHAGASLFGSGESAVTIRKPLVILPALGQFANVGDKLVARAVIRNDSGRDAAVEVKLQLDGTAETAKETMSISVPNGEARPVDFPVQLRTMGKAEWKWSARIEAGETIHEDHVVSLLTVGSPSVVLRETYLAEAGQAANDLLAGVNPQILEGTGTAAVTVSNTRLASLREGISQLLEYPYGCAEQTTSALIPWTLTRELGPIFPGPKKSEPEIQEAIARGVNLLFSMQTPGGGIAFWPGGQQPSIFASGYAALALALLEKQGSALPPGLKALLDYLSKEMRGVGGVRDEAALADRVLAVFALACSGRAEPAYHEELFRRRKELSHESRALLALAVLEAKGPAAMTDELLKTRGSAPETVSWFGGPARERAIRLMAWCSRNPRAPEVARLVKELLDYRVNGHWGTTQQTAWALLALARYYAVVESGRQPVEGTLAAGARDFPFHLTAEKPVETQTFSFDPSARLAGLEVRNPARSVLFSEALMVARPPAATQPRQDRGYAVSRSYRKIAEDGSLVEPVALKVGDRVLVSLRVETARAGHFVAIDDPLPAILEAVNPEFKSRSSGESGARDGVSDYREMRADRVVYFCDHLAPGAYTFSYLARVRSAGTATAPATKAEEMYRPERFGLGEATRVAAE